MYTYTATPVKASPNTTIKIIIVFDDPDGAGPPLPGVAAAGAGYCHPLPLELAVPGRLLRLSGE